MTDSSRSTSAGASWQALRRFGSVFYIYYAVSIRPTLCNYVPAPESDWMFVTYCAVGHVLRSRSYLGAQYHRLRARLGAPNAITAMADNLARIVYRMHDPIESL
jgi:hypothetical protein